MAVVDPNINITPSYEAVQRALQQRAALEASSGATNPLAALNAIATPIEQYASAKRKQQFELQKDYQQGVLDIAKSSGQLDIQPGQTLASVIQNPASVKIKPKVQTHKVTQEDIDQGVKSLGIDEEHKHAFDDLLNQEVDEKTLNATLLKRAEFIHSSGQGHTDQAEFLEDGSPVKGFYDKDKKAYFRGNGERATGKIQPTEKGTGSSLALEEKQQQFDENKLQKVEERLDPTKRRAGTLADAQKRLNGIQRLQALFNGYANDLTPQEWEEASLAWASVLGAGTGISSRAQIEALVPKTLRGNVKAQLQWFMNKPMGTDQQEFAKRVQLGMARESHVNSTIVKESQLKGISGFQDALERNPDRARTLFENYGLTPGEVHEHYPKIAKKAYPEMFENGKFVGNKSPTESLGANKIRIKAPDGTTGTIDKSDLNDALNSGYRVIE